MKQRCPAATLKLDEVGYVPPARRKCCGNCSAPKPLPCGVLVCQRFEVRLYVSKHGICRFHTKEKDFEPFRIEYARGPDGRFLP